MKTLIPDCTLPLCSSFVSGVPGILYQRCRPLCLHALNCMVRGARLVQERLYHYCSVRLFLLAAFIRRLT
ncbi:hypothetical protein AAW18_00305 [Xanthomonas campestris pv. campestris]|nr:hypothetical protein AAW18_00305 [Xanthomonas campestris pv. campestris]